MLQFLNYNKDFWLETDASNISIEVVLTKESDDSDIRLLVAYSSRSLKKAKRIYSTTDWEGLAII